MKYTACVHKPHWYIANASADFKDVPSAGGKEAEFPEYKSAGMLKVS